MHHLIRHLILCSSALAMTTPLLSHAEPQGEPQDESKRSTARSIEATLRQHPHTHLVTRYEIGEIDWTMRMLRTLGVGAHTLLSPTGGWGHTDLARVATENALHQISRLSAELYRGAPNGQAVHERNLPQNRCAWEQLSRHFSAPSPLWMSDGSVHLSAVIRFEVYELCLWGAPLLKSESSALTLNEKIHSLESTIMRAAPRAVISIRLTELDNARLLRCLTPIPTLTATAREALSVMRRRDAERTESTRWWRAVRWLRESQEVAGVASTREQVQLYIRPTLKLGEASCVSAEHPKSGSRGGDASAQREVTPEIRLKQRLTPSQHQALKRAMDHPGGAELWLWVRE